jgi:hypothetical protein
MRPTAAYIGALSHPIRLVVNKGLAGRDAANFLSIDDALELCSDLTAAIAAALREENVVRLPAAKPISKGSP